MLRPTIAVLLISIIGCTDIKKDNVVVLEEEGTEITSKSQKSLTTEADVKLGYWVGNFEPDVSGDSAYDIAITVDEGFYWNRENKINLSIDKIEGANVNGHAVVAGNNRPFTGTVEDRNGIWHFNVSEPGDMKYDGKFKFQISDSVLSGTWESFRAIQIPKRKYVLKRQQFKYDASMMLDESERFIDWQKYQRGPYLDEFEDFGKEYATATEKIYKINASKRLLTRNEVANLMRGDLLIIRNTIYARHGYSFKSLPLRVFFDRQSWYIPVSADIKKELTEIEKKNIALLLSFEKNAKEYYDYFGRG